MIEKFRLVGRKLFEEGLISSHGGNLSVREGDSIFITRSGSMLSELENADIIEVPLAGESEKDKLASVELPVHRAVFQKTGAKAICHAHPPEAIALSFEEEKIFPQDAEGRYYMRAIPVVRTKEAIASPDAVRQLPLIFGGGYRACIIKGHGSFAVGEDLLEAYKFTSVLASSCKILAITKSLSKPAPAPAHAYRHDSSGANKNDLHNRYKRRAAIPEGIGIMGRRQGGLPHQKHGR